MTRQTLREALADRLEQLDAGHAGHVVVAEDEVDVACFSSTSSAAAPFEAGCQHGVAIAAQGPLEQA